MLFGRLTERAQRVLAHAQEAIRLNHSNIEQNIFCLV